MGQKIHPTGFRLPVTPQLGVALVREQPHFAACWPKTSRCAST